MKLIVSLILASVLLIGCTPKNQPERLVERAELGIFFGGQIQEREQIAFTLDRGKQTQGFRIRFRGPLARPARVHWEIDQPGPRGRGRMARLGEIQARPGMEQLDQELEFKPGDPLGVWNVRVLVDDELVIDRPIFVFDLADRKRAQKEAQAEAKSSRARTGTNSER